MQLSLIVQVVVLAAAAYLVAALLEASGAPDPTRPPRVPLWRLVWGVVRDRQRVWVGIRDEIGPVSVVRLPLLGDAYLFLGPSVSKWFHTHPDLDLVAGNARIIRDFAPRGAFDPHPRWTVSNTTGVRLNKTTSSPMFLPGLHEVAQAMVHSELWRSGNVPSLFAEVTSVTMDILFHCTFGIPRTHPRQPELKQLFVLLDPERQLRNPRSLYDRRALMGETQELYDRLAVILRECVEERRAQGPADPNDQLLQSAKDAADENGETDWMMMVGLVWGFTFAAQLNTLANMGWILTRISRDPALAAMVYDEQRRVFAASQPGVPLADAEPTAEDLVSMTLIDSLIAENTRLVNPLAAWRETTSPVTYGDWTIPKGSWLWFLHSSVHMDAGLYPDSLAFNPARVIPTSDDGSAKDTVRIGQGSLHGNPNLLVWGTGRHPCLGARFAIAAVKSVISAVTRNYELEHTEKEWPATPIFSMGSMRPTVPVPIRVRARAGAVQAVSGAA